uniref:Myelin basic protein n=1 Tax=Panagrolaimus sp. PS1159 TaxID=55785 RepID=A0AC35FEV1_9BILA
CGLGNGYVSNDSNKTSPSGSEAHRPKKKHSGIRGFFKDLTKPQ